MPTCVRPKPTVPATRPCIINPPPNSRCRSSFSAALDRKRSSNSAIWPRPRSPRPADAAPWRVAGPSDRRCTKTEVFRCAQTVPAAKADPVLACLVFMLMRVQADWRYVRLDSRIERSRRGKRLLARLRSRGLGIGWYPCRRDYRVSVVLVTPYVHGGWRRTDQFRLAALVLRAGRDMRKVFRTLVALRGYSALSLGLSAREQHPF